MARQGSNRLRLVVWEFANNRGRVCLGLEFQMSPFLNFGGATLNRAETHRWNFSSLGRIMVLNNGGVPICL
jgi:hypothetical protein